MWPPGGAHNQQQQQQPPSLSVVTTVWGVTSTMTNDTPNMTHDPMMSGIPTTNTVNSVQHPFSTASANPAKQYGQQGE